MKRGEKGAGNNAGGKYNIHTPNEKRRKRCWQ
jgi:hypothetical protein